MPGLYAPAVPCSAVYPNIRSNIRITHSITLFAGDAHFYIPYREKQSHI